MLPAAGCGDVRTVGRCWGCRAGGGGGRDGAGRGVRSQMPAAQVRASAVSSLAQAAVLVGLKPASQVGVGVANRAGEGVALGLWARPVGVACGRGLWAWPVGAACGRGPSPASASFPPLHALRLLRLLRLLRSAAFPAPLQMRGMSSR